MKPSKSTNKIKETKDKLLPFIEIVEFNNPVEISGDGEYLYIIEVEPNQNLVKEFIQQKKVN